MTAQIPLGDARPLWPARTRTRVVRLVLGVALIGTGAAALLTVHSPHAEATPLASNTSKGVIVLDLSSSVENLTLDEMHRTLSQLSRSKGRYGLVVFSDQAYEALPPGTPASELKPYAAFFKKHISHARASSTSALNSNGGVGTTYPTNPWETGFSLGTSISTGLDLAESIVIGARTQQPAVWLVSDLADDPTDIPLLLESLKSYRQRGVALHVLPLDALPMNEAPYRGLIGSVEQFETPGATATTGTASNGFPVGLCACALVIAVLLGANEILSRPLRWLTGQPTFSTR